MDAIKLRHTTLNANIDIRVKAENLNLTMDEALIANSFQNEISTIFVVGHKDTDLRTSPIPALKN